MTGEGPGAGEDGDGVPGPGVGEPAQPPRAPGRRRPRHLVPLVVVSVLLGLFGWLAWAIYRQVYPPWEKSTAVAVYEALRREVDPADTAWGSGMKSPTVNPTGNAPWPTPFDQRKQVVSGRVWFAHGSQTLDDVVSWVTRATAEVGLAPPECDLVTDESRLQTVLRLDDVSRYDGAALCQVVDRHGAPLGGVRAVSYVRPDLGHTVRVSVRFTPSRRDW